MSNFKIILAVRPEFRLSLSKSPAPRISLRLRSGKGREALCNPSGYSHFPFPLASVGSALTVNCAAMSFTLRLGGGGASDATDDRPRGRTRGFYGIMNQLRAEGARDRSVDTKCLDGDLTLKIIL